MEDKGYGDPDNSLMFILILVLFFRSCLSCENIDVEKRLDRLETKIDSINAVR